jgi:hypothetical protein
MVLKMELFYIKTTNTYGVYSAVYKYFFVAEAFILLVFGLKLKTVKQKNLRRYRSRYTLNR